MVLAQTLMIFGAIFLIFDLLGLLPIAVMQETTSFYIAVITCGLIGIVALIGGACMMDKVNAEQEQNICEVEEK